MRNNLLNNDLFFGFLHLFVFSLRSCPCVWAVTTEKNTVPFDKVFFSSLQPCCGTVCLYQYVYLSMCSYVKQWNLRLTEVKLLCYLFQQKKKKSSIISIMKFFGQLSVSQMRKCSCSSKMNRMIIALVFVFDIFMCNLCQNVPEF